MQVLEETTQERNRPYRCTSILHRLILTLNPAHTHYLSYSPGCCARKTREAEGREASREGCS